MGILLPDPSEGFDKLPQVEILQLHVLCIFVNLLSLSVAPLYEVSINIFVDVFYVFEITSMRLKMVGLRISTLRYLIL